MGQAEELIRMAKKLDKMVSRKNTEGALDLLKKLNSCAMTIQLLQTTKIGVAVNTVRKHCSDKEVVTLAKLLIKNWKRLLESSGTQKGKKENDKDIAVSGWKAETALSSPVNVSKSPDGKLEDRKLNKSTPQEVMLKSSSSLVSKPDRDPKDASTSQKSHLELKKERRDSKDSRSSSSTAAAASSSPKRLSVYKRASTSSNPVASSPGSHKNKEDSKDERSNDKSRGEVPRMPASPVTPTFGTSVCFLPSCYLTGDSIRDKCIEMVSAALKMDDDYKEFGVKCDKMAAEIEDHIFQELKSTDMKYRNRVRSRISNLKDPKNPGLRRNVLCGAIPPALIAKMTAEEMASDELKELRNAMTQEAIREHQMAKTGGTTTDLFQCGKCKKKNCTYNQVQTRSADEPMTTFVLCNECGNRWKFC
ncbi:transcription elongation factor A protein 3 isoform X3 [Python bivittatus]|uniref:Transcription elongation factor A protein 3 isoform X3 n=2 Tax=Python bivittatus TaxID=176946 RepID=A0A9F2RA43_PYTBI|nr:transcription elongation factor A protein 3 isoform X3 [Python bivittatus]